MLNESGKTDWGREFQTHEVVRIKDSLFVPGYEHKLSGCKAAAKGQNEVTLYCNYLQVTFGQGVVPVSLPCWGTAPLPCG